MNADTPIRLKMNLVDWSVLVFLSTLWGASFFFMEVAVSALPVFTIVAVRVALAALALNVFLILRGRNLFFSREVWRALGFMALIGQVVPFCLIVWGQIYITAGLASILNATVPFFTVLIAQVMTDDEKLTPNGLAGVLIGFVGVVLIMGPQALSGLSNNLLAQLAVLAAAAMYGLTIIYARRFRKMGVPPLSAAAGQLTCSSIMLVPVALLFDMPWTIAMPSIGIIGALAGLGLLSTALAFILYYRLISSVGGNNTALVTFLIPVSAIWLGVMFLQEALNGNQIAGMMLIGVGLLVIDGRVFSRFSPGRT